MAQKQNEVYTKTYTTFGGSDIIATFNGKVIGELQAVTYSVTREKAPIYTLGDSNPRSFSRGKRGIAGSLIFTVFDRDAIMETLGKNDDGTPKTIYSPYSESQLDDPDIKTETGIVYGVEAWNRLVQANVGEGGLVGFKQLNVRYVDQIPPFNITITFANEYGQTAVMRVYGVELINEGSSMSIDDVVTERAATFVARALEPIHKLVG